MKPEIIILIFIIILIIINNKLDKIIKSKDNKEINFLKYKSKEYLMTKTELAFYKELKNITDDLNLKVCPQVNLESIIKVEDNNISYRNRIKSKSIDYVIVNNKDCRIICCIELDDYNHKKEKVKINDKFKDRLFEEIKIPLHRIEVSKDYNFESIKTLIINDIDKCSTPTRYSGRV